MSLTLQDKKYIDNSIKTSANELRLEFRNEFELFRKEIRLDFQHYIGAYTELIRDDIRKIIEISSSKPDREEVREIAKEEIRFHLHRPE